ncbi:hypothetical protein ABK040_016318 [Willaertia magna]
MSEDVVLFGAGVADRQNDPWFFKNVMKKYMLNYIYDDLLRAERAVKEMLTTSKISYTIVRPPQLVDSPLTLDYIYGENDNYLDGTQIIGREDVASFILRCLFEEKFSSVSGKAYNLNMTRKLNVKVDNMKVLKNILPYHKYLIFRLITSSIMFGVISIGGVGMYYLKRLLFPNVDLRETTTSNFISNKVNKV